MEFLKYYSKVLDLLLKTQINYLAQVGQFGYLLTVVETRTRKQTFKPISNTYDLGPLHT
jgi:hypothetical protein